MNDADGNIRAQTRLRLELIANSIA